MPFKIVQTKEKGRILLSVVPDSWESDGKLKWPPKGKLKTTTFKNMLCDENIVPGVDWVEVKCRSKQVCSTYDEAVALTKQMSDQSDTDPSASDVMPPPLLPAKRKIVHRDTIGRVLATDFNNVVWNLMIFSMRKLWIEII